MKELKINKNDAGQRLDKFITKAVPRLPKSLLNKYIRLKRIKVNGKRAEISTRIEQGDIISLYINDEFFEAQPRQDDFLRLAPSLDIVYEDEHIMLINKPVGMVVHEDEGGERNTLINNIKAYLYQNGQWVPSEAHSFEPALCNRIDRNTQGIVIAAKTAEALRIINEKIRDREITKRYLCLVLGTPAKKSARITHYITRDKSEKRVYVSDKPQRGALTAIMSYKALESKGGISLLECTLETGRTHQIRAQLAHIGNPLCGDTKYGTVAQNKSNPFKYQALCSYMLTFDFKTDAGALNYLKGKTYRLENAFFSEYFDRIT